MTLAGAIVLGVVCAALLLWILNLVRVGRLYVGYALALGLALGCALGVALVPRLRTTVMSLLATLFPGAELVTLLAIGLAVILVYLLSQLTVISDRLSRLVQEISLRDVAQKGNDTPEHDGRHARSRPT